MVIDRDDQELSGQRHREGFPEGEVPQVGPRTFNAWPKENY